VDTILIILPQQKNLEKLYFEDGGRCGNLSSISYTFYNKNGKQIGSVNYNAKNGSIKRERE